MGAIKVTFFISMLWAACRGNRISAVPLPARGGFGVAQPMKREAFLEFYSSQLFDSKLEAPVNLAV